MPLTVLSLISLPLQSYIDHVSSDRIYMHLYFVSSPDHIVSMSLFHLANLETAISPHFTLNTLIEELDKLFNIIFNCKLKQTDESPFDFYRSIKHFHLTSICSIFHEKYVCIHTKIQNKAILFLHKHEKSTFRLG